MTSLKAHTLLATLITQLLRFTAAPAGSARQSVFFSKQENQMRQVVVATLVALAFGAPAVGQSTLFASPPTLNFILDPNDEIFQALDICSSGAPIAFTISASPNITPIGGWLSADGSSTIANSSCAGITISVLTKGLAVGTYKGTITAKSTSNTVIVPVTLTVTNGPPLQINAICNAASYASGTISPGEVIVIFGSFEINNGTLQYDPNSLVPAVSTNQNGVYVLMNGVNSNSKLAQSFYSPLIYTSPTQISAVVPYNISPGTVSVSVNLGGYETSNVVSETMVPTVPGLFTANASGTGPGAILNQDYSLNSSTHPAAKGSVVVLYATGEGNTSPAGLTGVITQVRATAPITPIPLGTVQVLIDGIPANVTFAGEAPGMVSGVMQVNAQIPSQAHSGSVSVQISVGGVWTQSNVTVAVQ